MNKTLKRNQYRQNLKLYDLVIFIFCLCTIMFERALLFNPLVLASLFLSYKRGLTLFTVSSFSMIALAGLLDIYYGLEVFLVFFTFLVTNYTIMRVSSHKYREYFGISAINGFLLVSVSYYSLNVENIISVLMVIAIEVAIIRAFSDVLKIVEDDRASISILSAALVHVILGFSFMFFINAGLMVLRFFMLLVIFTNKKETSALSLCISFILISLFYDYSFDSLVMIFAPLAGGLIIHKYKEFVFMGIQILTLFLVETPIFFNAHFYQAFAALTAVVLIPKNALEKISEIASRAQTQIMKKIIDQEVLMNQQLLYVTNYLDIVEGTTHKPIENPILKGSGRVQSRTCLKCSHFDLCPLKNKIPDLLQEKLKANVKKQISEVCLTPYKLIMELQQAYHIYIDEQSYYQEALEKQKQYRFAVKKIVNPVKKLQKFKSEEERIALTIARNGIDYKRLSYKEKELIIVLDEKNYEEQNDDLINCLATINGKGYVLNDKNYNVLLKEYVLIFVETTKHRYDFGVVSKGIDDCFNGDNYTVIEKNGCVHFVLSDGMGHGKKAMDNSKYLINAMSAQINISDNLLDNVQETNNLMLLRNDVEQYATFDYIKINLQTLRTIFLKAGCYASYIHKKKEIVQVDTIGVPLGIIPSIDPITEEVLLEKNDVVFMVSDGIGEWFSDNYVRFEYLFNLSSSEIARSIFMEFEKENERKDDATIITIKII